MADEELLQRPQDIGLEILRNPNRFTDHFQQEYSVVRRGILDNLVANKDNILAQADESEKMEVLRELETLFDDKVHGFSGGQFIQMEVYKPFAFDKGFTKKTKWGDSALLISELSEKQRAEWEQYLTSISFTENRRILFARAIHNVFFPTVTTKYRPNNVPLAAELENAKRRIVNRLLPNIRDDEAQMALGQRYTADIARSSVTPQWFID